MRIVVILALLVGTARAEEPKAELIEHAHGLLVVGACAEGTPPPRIKPAIIAAHCKQVRRAHDAYRKNWLAVARPFFAANVPASVPKRVVYPFAGGDLATALAVYPDADEITTLSLEPAGDPRALGRLSEKQLKAALATVATELTTLYRANYSVTMNMIAAMRGGQLPTQLIFSLSALWLHDYEPVALRYFRLTPDGDVRYLTTADFEALDRVKDTGKRNRELSNVELRFRKRGSSREQVYRHIRANLDDAHLAADPAALRHLVKKGKVAGLTKAASYLLTFDAFQTMRQYVIDHVEWMVSDSTGLPPKYGTPAGFEYETWGSFESSNMPVGKAVTPAWRAVYAAQPERPLGFRFGYPDGKHRGHLIIMRKAGGIGAPPRATPAAAPRAK
ncbi:MAG: hypothetical protein M3680_03720 [Myxococcota bacterium]|nr:hypothetical protein [Myxococcota bacterium]